MTERSDLDGRARAIFERAIELDGGERASFVERACADDVVLAQEVGVLLECHGREALFLESPPVPAPGHGPAVAPPESLDPVELCEHSFLGEYRLLEVIGRGGMGIVYRAEQAEPLRREVAIKVLRREASEESLARFHAECQALALMRHPNVAAVIDRGATSDGLPYIVMEYVAGEHIATYCDLHALDTRERLGLFADVCDAIQHAHQKGIVHRDIKASNILVERVDGEPRPRVLDFGVAKGIGALFGGGDGVTHAGEVIGTPESMSPEQLGWNARDVDTRTDIYSLGVLLYQLLTGRLPIESSRLRQAPLAEVQRLICEVDPPRPSTQSAGPGSASIAEDLDWIVMKCLEKDPNRRYASASDLAVDVRRFLAHEPVAAGPATRRYRIGKFVRRNRLLVSAAAGAVLALAAGLSLTAWQAVRARRAERLAGARLVEVERSQAGLREQRDQALAAEREARRSARVADEVSGYMVELLGAPNPDFDGKIVRSASDVRVIDVLDDAVQRLDGRFPDEPVVEAQLRTSLGTTYLGLGRLVDAHAQYTRALELLRSVLGEEDEVVFEAMVRLGAVELRTGRLDKVVDLCLGGLETKDRLGAGEDFGRLELTRLLAQAFVLQGRFEEAEELYLRAVEGLSRLLDRRDWETLDARTGLGQLYAKLGRFEDAAACLTDVLEDFGRIGHSSHVRAMVVRADLAHACDELGRYAQARELHEELLAYWDETHGRDHPAYLSTLANLSRVLLRMLDLEGAERSYREVLERSPPGSEGAIVALNGLGQKCALEDDFADAEAYFADALAALEGHSGLDPSHGVKIESNLAALYLQFGQLEEAESVLESAVERARADLGPAHPEVAAVLLELAGVRAGRDPTTAEELFREAVERRTRIHGAGNARTIEATLGWAEFLLEQNRATESVALLEGVHGLVSVEPAMGRDLRERVQALLARARQASSGE